MKKRHVMRALVAAATALALTACGSTGSSDTSKSTSTASAASTSSGSEAGTENTITIPAGESVSQDSDVTAMVAVDFTTMDPMDTSDTLSGGVQRMMMDGRADQGIGSRNHPRLHRKNAGGTGSRNNGSIQTKECNLHVGRTYRTTSCRYFV